MKSSRRNFLFLLVALLLPALGRADGIADILARKTVRIGVCEFAPWTFTNKAGQLEGFEIDLGRQIAADLGVQVEFKLSTLEDAFGALNRGDLDFIAAGLAITPERALRVEFSYPYFESGATVATNRKLAPGIKRAEDLNKAGFTVGIVEDTFSAHLAAQLYDVATIRKYADASLAETDLREGRLHGYLTSLPGAKALARRYADKIELPLADPLVGSVAGFGVKRGNQALLNYLNAWVAAKTAERYLASTYQYWFFNYDWLAHARN